MRAAKKPLACLALAATTVLGCEEAREPAIRGVPVAHETRYARVAISEDNPHRICGGTLGSIDRHVEYVASRLDVEPAPIEVYWYEQAPETLETAAYFDFAAVVTVNDTLLHELVHAVAIPTIGTAQHFLTEDLAHAFEDDPTLLEDTRSPSQGVQDDVRGSGHFSRWLLETRGEDRYKMLFDTPTPTIEGIRDRFRRAYGSELEELEADFFAEAPAWYPVVGLCDGLEEVHWDQEQGSLSFQTVADCSSASAFGHTGSEEAPYVEAFNLVVPQDFIGRDFAAVDAVGWMIPCTIGEGPTGETISPVESEAVDHFDGSLGYDLQRPFVYRFKSTAYRVEIPFREDGEVVSLELSLR